MRIELGQLSDQTTRECREGHEMTPPIFRMSLGYCPDRNSTLQLKLALVRSSNFARALTSDQDQLKRDLRTTKHAARL